MPDISQILNEPAKKVKAPSKSASKSPSNRTRSAKSFSRNSQLGLPRASESTQSPKPSSAHSRRRGPQRPGRGKRNQSPLLVFREKLIYGKQHCLEILREQKVGEWLIDSATQATDNIKGIFKLWR